MIPTWNDGPFLRTALESVLAQDPGRGAMQIEVVDDASDDAPRDLVQAIGGGRVEYFRQPRRTGHIGNFASCISRARGEIVHLLHGDDLVLPGFYEALGRAFTSDPEIGAAFCRWSIIDAQGTQVTVAEPEQEVAGRLRDALARLASEQRIVTPSIAVRRSVWEELEGFDDRLVCAEDYEMWVRIAAHYPIWYEPGLYAAYRSHADSNTGRHSRNARELRYTAMAIGLFRPLLPPERAPSIVRKARRAYARTALANAARYRLARDGSAMRAHLAMALKLDPSPRTILACARAALQKVGDP
jgi:GT2 family glycosyltransferase